MTIEQDIFKRAKIDFNKLAGYGFVKSELGWIYDKTFMNGDFKAVVRIDYNGNISGNVYETDCDEIYFPLRVESMAVGFAGEVRGEYEKILKDIKAHCCQINYFMFSQANRLAQRCYEKYGDYPCFPWDKFDGFGVFKNPNNNKWYALIMNIDRSKLDDSCSGETEAVNIKSDKEKISTLIKQNGFYPAYHMNKKNWVTVILDDTVDDDLLFELVDESHAFTLDKRAHR